MPPASARIVFHLLSSLFFYGFNLLVLTVFSILLVLVLHLTAVCFLSNDLFKES